MQRLTVREAIYKSAVYLSSAGCAAARLEAELLVGKCVGLDRVQLYVQFDRPLNQAETAELRSLIAARAKEKVPVAYLTGHRYFLGLDLLLPYGVFIPRPETEELVEAVADRLEKYGGADLELLDLCTGSGAIALSLARRFTTARLTAIDIDPTAVAAARVNAERCGLAERLRILQGDLWAPLGENESYHAVISNPPYIPSALLPTLPPEIAAHEPPKALDGGVDGLDFIRRILAGAARYLKKGGFCAIEHGCADEEELIAMARADGFTDISCRRDLAGRPRLLLAGLP